MLYHFGEFRLDDERFTLSGPEGQIHVEPQVFGVLHYLLVHRDRLVTKEELFDEIWGTRFVSESAITTRLKAARRAVGDDGQAQRVIKTVHGRGYHFVADVEIPDSRPRRGLPVRRTALIGRDGDVATIVDRVRNARLVTITGPGGVGKTSVALAVATQLDAELPDGAVFVDVVPVRSLDDLGRALAEAADVRGDASRSLDQLVGHLAARDVLIVLDNCEHLVDECAALIDRMLRAGAAVRLLTTSREPLGLVGEHVWPLPSLGSAAPVLFVERAREVEPRIDWDPHDPRVVELCRRLDALPLAVELAAGQLRRFELDELSRRLEGRLTLLTRRAPDAPERHSTMEATIDWSYRLLELDEKRLLRHLSVFPATFDLHAVEASAPPLDGETAVAFGELVSKSLVSHHPGAGRYRLLETIRVFAGSLLQIAGEAPAARERHRLQVRERVGRASRLDRWMSGRLAADHRIDLENARQAFRLSVDEGHAADAVEVALGASFLWRNAIGCTEGGAWVDDLLAMELPVADRVWAHILQADVGQGRGDHELMFDAAAAALQIVEDPGARCVAAHFAALADLTDPERGRARFHEALSMAVEADDPRLITLMETFVAVAEVGAGAHDDACRRLDRLDRVASDEGYDRFILHWAGWLLGLAERDARATKHWMSKQQEYLDRTGIHETWITLLSSAMTDVVGGDDVTESLVRILALADREGYQADADCMLVLAYASICADRHDEAATLLGTAIRSRFNSTAHYVLYRAVLDRFLQQQLDPEQLAAAMARGRTRTATEALREYGITSPRPTSNTDGGTG